MKRLPKQSAIFTLTLLLLQGAFLVNAKSDFISPQKPEIAFEETNKLRYQNPDSTLRVLQSYYLYATHTADTSLAIRALMRLAAVYGHQAHYKESYDQLWTALLLADAAGMEMTKSSIYRSLGRYYSFYNRKKNALKFLNLSLSIKKELIANGEVNQAQIVENYHAFCATYRELNESDLGQVYLDSSFLYYSPAASRTGKEFLHFEQGALHNINGKHEAALKIFQRILPWFTEHIPSYNVLIFYYLGDTYRHLENFRESEKYYQKALETSAFYHSHIDFTPLNHQKLSRLYFANGEYKKGYESLDKAQKLDATFFDSRSEHNRSLLEIQDAFRQEKEEQAIFQKEQRLIQLEKEEEVLFLQKVILSGLLVFLVLFGILYFNYVKSKHKAEKQLIQKKRELEIQKANEIVELKNKELAASVLKLIKKETFIDDLKDKLKQGQGDINRQEVRQLLNSITSSNADNWKEFEARFLSVNKSFYQRLNRQFPELTQGDQKLCALIKLNFSSKEIAKLLGISVESTHTTRSRLRKKLSLSRGDNLKEFIANV